MVVQILYVIPALVSAQNNHVITDPEGDVVLETYTDRIEGVERPNIDITRAGIAESNGIVTISLTVKGIITSSADINYHITIRDEYKWNAGISYNDGICKMEWTDLEDNIKEIYLEANGVGTNTTFINFSLEEVEKPSYLYISEVNTFEYFMDEFDNFESYTDTCEPKSNETPPIDNETQPVDKDNESPGFTFELLGIAFTLAVVIYYKKKL